MNILKKSILNEYADLFFNFKTVRFGQKDK